MQDLFKEKEVFSVSELSFALKNLVEQSFSSVKLKGEISGLKIHSSGHAYFSLKDENSLIDSICWRGTLSSLSLKLQDGMDVICRGRITTYPARSKYQIIIESAELAGVGALMKLLQERKEKLEKEGLFSSSHKKPLPFLPKRIGVITSPTGAVIQDILHRIRDRFPCGVAIWPVAVQGPTASEEIARALYGFNLSEQKPDVIIVARGGGSLEDLWAFNEENVVRAVFASTIPVISAVGHETDTTLIDFVADQRAPTPTAAAEMAVPVKEDLSLTIHQYSLQLVTGIQRLLKEYKISLISLERGLGSPKKFIESQMQYLDEKTERLLVAIKNYKDKKAQYVGTLGQLLESYSHHKVLQRGFTLIKDASGALISSSKTSPVQQPLTIIFHDGTWEAHTIQGR